MSFHRKHKMANYFHLDLYGLLNAIPEPQKSKFPNWKTLLFAKWKTRSANYGFRQSKRLSELLFLRILLYFH